MVINETAKKVNTAVYGKIPVLRDDGVFSTRLVKVLPDLFQHSSSRWMVHCSLHATPLESAKLNYTCLSYVWNPPSLDAEVTVEARPQEHHIILNGSIFAVGRNLCHFLENARVLYPNRPFWIDALSIDQSNEKEKNSQVQHMGEIYSVAEGVVAWMGRNRGLARDLAYFQQRHESRLKLVQRGLLDAKGRPPDRSLVPKTLYENTYWTRAWITQEIVCSRHLTLLANSSRLDWEYFHRNQLSSKQALQQLEKLKLFKQVVMFPEENRSRGLVLNLHWFGDKQCFKLHDRVYSLLAICDPNISRRIKVDYGVSNWELAVQVLRSDPASLCLCSIRRVAHLLKLDISRTSGNQADRPWRQLAVSITVPKKLALPVETETLALEKPVSPPFDVAYTSGILPNDDNNLPDKSWLPEDQLDEMFPGKAREDAAAFYTRGRQRKKQIEIHNKQKAHLYAQANHTARLSVSTHAICLRDICGEVSNHVTLDQTHKRTKAIQHAYREECITHVVYNHASLRDQYDPKIEEWQYRKVKLDHPNCIRAVAEHESGGTVWSFSLETLLEVLLREQEDETELCTRMLKGGRGDFGAVVMPGTHF